MENIKLPLDSNLNPIGVLQPGGNITLNESENFEITESGIYRIFTESGTNGIAELEFDMDGTISNVYSTVGTIEYFYISKGTIFYPVSGSFRVTKMR